MTEYDPLAKTICTAYENTLCSGDLPEWHDDDWQAAAKAARKFIAAEEDGWVEVSCIAEIHTGDEVQVIHKFGDRTDVKTGVAYTIDSSVIYTEGGFILVDYSFDQYIAVRVRRPKQEPPTAPLIIAYELEGKGGYPEGIVMAKVSAGDQRGLYAPVEGHTTATLFWHPKRILRYDVAKAVVDG